MSAVKLNVYDVIRGTIVTEKAAMNDNKNIYTFEVAKSAVKSEIKQAVSQCFDVDVISVKTMRRINKIKGRAKYKLTASQNKKPSYKKIAYVRLKDGDSIDFLQYNRG